MQSRKCIQRAFAGCVALIYALVRRRDGLIVFSIAHSSREDRTSCRVSTRPSRSFAVDYSAFRELPRDRSIYPTCKKNHSGQFACIAFATMRGWEVLAESLRTWHSGFRWRERVAESWTDRRCRARLAWAANPWSESSSRAVSLRYG